MIKKEWPEVSKQSLYFVLAMAGMVLLVGLVNLLQGKPLEGEKVIIMLGLWLLMFSMFLGLSPFALDSKQKGMEYLLTLPFSRRRLLFIKLLPRLAAIVLFYLMYIFLYSHMGNDAFGVGFTVFSLAYFSLFFISYSLSVIHENFIVQSIWAGIALCGYLALCLYVVFLGFSWKFGMPSSWIGNTWQDLSYDMPSLLSSIAVFLLMLVPFVASFFLAFKKFDLKPARAFNRRQLLFFIPLLLLALVASLGVVRLAQKSSAYDDAHYFILGNQQLLKTSWPGKLTLNDENQQRRLDTKRSFLWHWNVFAVPGKLFLTAFDVKDYSTAVIRLNMGDLAWNIVRSIPHGYLANTSFSFSAFRQYGQNLVFLQRNRAEAERPGMQSALPLKSDGLDLVVIDMNSEKSKLISYQDPLFRSKYQPIIFAHDEINGRQFWLISGFKKTGIIRLWEDGRAENLGFSQKMPVYFGHLLFSHSERSLIVRRLLASGSETVKEIDGEFGISDIYYKSLDTVNVKEVYASRDQRIVRINLDMLTVDDVGPDRGLIEPVPPGDFYYVEFENWPGQGTDRWKKLYRLQKGKMVLLKQFDFNDAGYGHVFVDTFGIILRQYQINKTSTRIFVFPDLQELKFKN
jgi:hypothetical protein